MIRMVMCVCFFCVCSFIYSENLPPSQEQQWESHKEFFKKNGYIWIKDFFSREQVALLRNWAEEIHHSTEKMLLLMNASEMSPAYFTQIPGTLIIVPEAGNPLQACRAEDLLTCYPSLHAFIQGTVTSYLHYLMGEPYVLFKDKINFKWPGGGAFLPHQDFPAYEPFGPREHITAMVSIDTATLENGCLHVAKDWIDTFSQDPDLDLEQLQKGRAILPYVEGGASHGSIQSKYSDKIQWLALETAPGDLVLFNSFLPHYSEPNKSKSSRRALFLTHNRLKEGDHRQAYYHAKRYDPCSPVFHFATPTHARTK